jgi:hypothetical protein
VQAEGDRRPREVKEEDRVTVFKDTLSGGASLDRVATLLRENKIAFFTPPQKKLNFTLAQFFLDPEAQSCSNFFFFCVPPKVGQTFLLSISFYSD